MFKNLFKKEGKHTEIYAPLNGKIVALENVDDPVFSEKMMGEGIAIKPTDGKVHAPVKGEVIQIPKTKHAIGLQAEDGSEVLVHIGLETVGLNGEGFTINVNQGDQVNPGDLLMEFDLAYIEKNAKDTITPIVITNSQNSDKTYKMTEETSSTAGETVIITVSEK